MIHLTIDGKQIQVPEGTTVLRAAQSNDIHIPTLCDHPQLAPYGGCRLCLVDVPLDDPAKLDNIQCGCI